MPSSRTLLVPNLVFHCVPFSCRQQMCWLDVPRCCFLRRKHSHIKKAMFATAAWRKGLNSVKSATMIMILCHGDRPYRDSDSPFAFQSGLQYCLYFYLRCLCRPVLQPYTQKNMYVLRVWEALSCHCHWLENRSCNMSILWVDLVLITLVHFIPLSK